MIALVEGLRGVRARPWLALFVLEVCVGITFGTFTALVFHRETSPIDEGAHLSYVQLLATEQRLPVLGRDLMSIEAYSKRVGTYPELTEPPPDLGFGSSSWEAFQPPLYYIVAAPVFAVTPGSFETKFTATRLFGVLLLIPTALLVAALARDVAGDRWPVVAAFAGVVLLAPGFVVRAATVSNAALEPLMALLVAWLSLRTIRLRSGAWLLGASTALALAVLTKLTLAVTAPAVLVGAVAVGVGSIAPRRAHWLAGSVVAPLVLLGPWLLWNRSTYGTWTANEQAKQQQAFIVNPAGADYTWRHAVDALPGTLKFAHAQESSEFLRQPFDALSTWLGVAFVVTPAGFVFRRRRPQDALALALPLAAMAGALVFVTIREDWPALLPRYLLPVLPGWGIAAGHALDDFRADPSSPSGASAATRLLPVLVALGGGLLVWSATTPGWERG